MVVDRSPRLWRPSARTPALRDTMATPSSTAATAPSTAELSRVTRSALGSAVMVPWVWPWPRASWSWASIGGSCYVARRPAISAWEWHDDWRREPNHHRSAARLGLPSHPAAPDGAAAAAR